jgi:hypothetical protein
MTRGAKFLLDARSGSAVLWWSAAAMLAGFIACTGLQFVDDRLLIGVSVWEKPAKFFLSLTVQFITVAWALSLLSLRTRGVRIAIVAMFGAAWIELAYIIVRAARGEASHFNVATPLDAALYSIMGVGALTLTLTAGYIGWVIWRNQRGDMWTGAAGLGLLLGSVLATLTAGYMSSGTGHWVGGDLTDASGLPFFHWSMTGGDLRVSHFIGLHATQVIPFAAMGGSRWMVYGAALLVAGLTAATFIQALDGVPLFKI